MKTIETIVYTYDELSKEAKEKAREWWNNDDDYPFLSESMDNHATYLLTKNKIKADDIKVYYSLSFSQGDGAMIQMRGMWKSYTFKVTHSGHYYHYNSKEIDLESTKTGNDASDKTYEEFNNLYVEICRQLAQYGYDEIEYLSSEEAVAETLMANDYQFTIDGTIF